jgi:uncharacterized Zn finger protein
MQADVLVLALVLEKHLFADERLEKKLDVAVLLQGSVVVDQVHEAQDDHVLEIVRDLLVHQDKLLRQVEELLFLGSPLRLLVRVDLEQLQKQVAEPVVREQERIIPANLSEFPIPNQLTQFAGQVRSLEDFGVLQVLENPLLLLGKLAARVLLLDVLVSEQGQQFVLPLLLDLADEPGAQVQHEKSGIIK